MKRVLHLVPATPPAFNGLGDYARMLHRHWPEPRPEWHVAALRVTEGAKAAWPGIRFHPFEPYSDSLAKTLLSSGCSTVVLHYVPHGYHPKGVPGWLPKGLSQWKQASGGQLVTFFHELFAFSPPWRTAFWLAPTSIAILRNVVRLSDVAMTSNDLYALHLARYGGLTSTAMVLPIGSNVGVAAPANEPGRGPWRVAVFGTARTRVTTLEAHRHLLRLLAKHNLLSALVLIGSNAGDEDPALVDYSCPVERIVNATEVEISVALASCHLGLVATDEPRLFKSGVFAAYCAHGLTPIAIGRETDMPYLSVNPSSVGKAFTTLRDFDFQAHLRSRIAVHAAQADWTTTTKRWAEMLKACP